jgi:hypothetical protein
MQSVLLPLPPFWVTNVMAFILASLRERRRVRVTVGADGSGSLDRRWTGRGPSVL